HFPTRRSSELTPPTPRLDVRSSSGAGDGASSTIRWSGTGSRRSTTGGNPTPSRLRTASGEEHRVMSSQNRIQGRAVLVTGASSGIGEACARRFAAAGADLVLWARRIERLEALAAELERQHGAPVRVAAVDVRDRGAVFREAEALVQQGWVPDVLVNNAGLAVGLDPLHQGDPDDWERMIDTNIKGL